jgi:hypothetical protein
VSLCLWAYVTPIILVAGFVTVSLMAVPREVMGNTVQRMGAAVAGDRHVVKQPSKSKSKTDFIDIDGGQRQFEPNSNPTTVVSKNVYRTFTVSKCPLCIFRKPQKRRDGGAQGLKRTGDSMAVSSVRLSITDRQPDGRCGNGKVFVSHSHPARLTRTGAHESEDQSQDEPVARPHRDSTAHHSDSCGICRICVGGGLGFTVELFFLALSQLLSTGPHLHQRNPTLHYTWERFGPLHPTGASTNTRLEPKTSFPISPCHVPKSLTSITLLISLTSSCFY